MAYNQPKPDNVLRKALEFQQSGLQRGALDLLHQILTVRRHPWSPTHEKIVKLFIEIAVSLRENARETFMAYKKICGETQTASLENVIREYIALSEKKAQEALDQTSQGALAVQNVDLGEEGAEEVLLRNVSGEDAKARADRQILTPWLKHLWEAYRTVLDVLRNNTKVELLYHQTARLAFGFCLKYRRTAEFRRLGEMLRGHLSQLEKYADQRNAIDTNSPETQKLYLETRFEQLRVAADLEVWQEAYRTIEDIHQNMQFCAIPPSSQLMSTYYDKLAQIFWVSENPIFHAYSLTKCYQLVLISNPAMTAQDKTHLATSVLLASLSIPLEGRYAAIDEDIFVEENASNLRLADLLMFKRETPTRSRLLAEHRASGLLNDISEDGRAIYDLLEVKFGPLTLGKSLIPLLERFEKDPIFGRYIVALKHLTVVRLLQQLSTVFRTMKIDKFLKLAPALSKQTIEHIIMAAVKQGQLHLRVDHRTQLLVFVDETFETMRLRQQLALLAERLQQVCAEIEPVRLDEKSNERESIFSAVREGLRREREEVFERIKLIEKRKQDLEQAEQKKAQDEAERKEREAKARAEEEKRRMEEDKRRREQERLKKEEEEKEKTQKMEWAARLAKRAEEAKQQGLSAKAAQKAEKTLGAAKSAEELKKAAEELQRRAVEDREKRLKESWKRLDYMTRAMRIEELDVLVKTLEQKRIEDEKAAKELFQKRLAEHKAAHIAGLEERKRLSRMAPQKAAFEAKVMARRMKVYEAKKKEQDARLAKLEAERAAERKQREEEEAEREAEEERKRKEEEEREEREALEREREEEARRKRDEERKAQRAKDAELAAKRRAMEEGSSSSAPAASRFPRSNDSRFPSRVGESKAAAASPAGGDAPKKTGGYVPPSRRPASGASSSASEEGGGWRRDAAPAASSSSSSFGPRRTAAPASSAPKPEASSRFAKPTDDDKGWSTVRRK